MYFFSRPITISKRSYNNPLLVIIVCSDSIRRRNALSVHSLISKCLVLIGRAINHNSSASHPSGNDDAGLCIRVVPQTRGFFVSLSDHTPDPVLFPSLQVVLCILDLVFEFCFARLKTWADQPDCGSTSLLLCLLCLPWCRV